ncbi:MAG: dTMP kinase [Dethiobacteria bacterium]|jgi:dTMP kinase
MTARINNNSATTKFSAGRAGFKAVPPGPGRVFTQAECGTGGAYRLVRGCSLRGKRESELRVMGEQQKIGKKPGEGLFISFEGPDGAGKTTQARLLKDRLEACGLPVLLTREPGGTPIGEELRRLLLNPSFKEMTVISEALLYSAARAQLVSTLIRPALSRGEIVLCDRYLDSSIVYQGLAGGEDLEMVTKINLWATGKLLPAITILLDLEARRGLERLQKAETGAGAETWQGDRVEQKALSFHRRVQQGFLQIAAREKERFFVVSAGDKPEVVQAKIWRRVQAVLTQRGHL